MPHRCEVSNRPHRERVRRASHHRHSRPPGLITMPSIAIGTLISPGPFLSGPRWVTPAELIALHDSKTSLLTTLSGGRF